MNIFTLGTHANGTHAQRKQGIGWFPKAFVIPLGLVALMLMTGCAKPTKTTYRIDPGATVSRGTYGVGYRNGYNAAVAYCGSGYFHRH